MLRSRILATVLAGCLTPTGSVVAQAALQPGMALHYQPSAGPAQVWRVEAVETGLSHAGRSGCIRVRFAPGGPQTNADVRFTCVAGDTVLSWSEGDQVWRPVRPIGVDDTLELRGPRGVTRFLTGAPAADTISGEVIPVVATTVLTLDTLGVVVRRLRERYAPSLGTATWGAFDQPEGQGWRTTVEFRLVAIERPD